MNPLFVFILFFVSLLLTVCSPVLLPFVKITYFAPYLSLMALKASHTKALWHAFLIGFILDLLTANTPFGFWVINYILTLYALNFLKKLFFEDQITTLPLLSIFFAQISTLLYMFSNIFSARTLELNVKWAMIELGLLPLADGIFALIFFSLPLYYFRSSVRKTRKDPSSFSMVKD